MPYRSVGLIALLSLACQDASLPPAKTPSLIKAKAASSIQGAAVQWKAGENWVWDVHWRGLKVGTATLGVLAEEGSLRIESNFRTTGMAKDIRAQKHRLVTRLSGPNQARDDLHTALGRLRSWANPLAEPAKITLWHEGRKYIVNLAQPILDQGERGERLRVEGHVRSASLTLDLTLLLSTDASHTPMQVTLIHGGQQVHARLLSSDTSQ